MAQTRPSPTLSRGFTRPGRFLAPYELGVSRFIGQVCHALTELDSTRYDARAAVA